MKNSLKKYREANGFTQQNVAQKLGISTRAYQYIEAGKTDPSLSRAFAISRILSIPLESLFHDIA